MPRVSLRIAHAPREPAYPRDDDALGEALWAQLTDRLPRGIPRPTLVTAFAESVQLVDMTPLLAGGIDIHQATSAFASQPGAEAVATVAVMTRRRGRQVVGRFAVVFVEWPDGRWWCCARPLGVDGQEVRDVERDVSRAVEGAPKPLGLGAWFRRARFEGLTLQLDSGDVN